MRLPTISIPCSFFVRFVLSPCRFPFVSCIAFFAFLFASLGGGFLLLCSFVSALQRSRPPCEPEVCVFSFCAAFSCVLDVNLFLLFLLLLSLFRFRFGHCFILSFSCGYYAVSSVSVSAATRLAYDMYLDTYISTLISPFYFCLRYTICFSCCVYYLLFLFCFPPEVIFRSRVIGACPVTTDCIVAMS